MAGDEQLGEYRRRRDRARTPEPFDAERPSGDGPIFVVQRHSARRLHYDLRLERDGVLQSWAVPKGLPTRKGGRRLAVHTEDHPLRYASFEGTIPAGEYGAGTMDVYDTGPYELVEQKRDGGLTVRLGGQHLRGEWTLVPARLDGDERQWLLIRKDAGSETRAERRYEPMLATLSTAVPKGAGWLFEVKLDGFRAVARLVDGEAALWSRRGNDLTERFEAVANDLGRGLRSPDCVVDGEIVAVDDAGRPSFSLLQQSRGRLVYYVFDLLELEGEPWFERPLHERRERLRALVDESSRAVRFSAAFDDGPALLAAAEAQGLEGVVAKRADSVYAPGRRSREWQKLKVRGREVLPVVGFTRGDGARERLGSLVLAIQREGELVYAGNVGSGFTEGEIDDVLARLEPLRCDDCPLASIPKGARFRRSRVVWVHPRYGAEVEFTEWTHDGHVRAPVFHALVPLASGRDETVPDLLEQPAEDERPSFEVRNRDKVFFPRDGITKGDLIDYYDAVAGVLVPHLRDRPFTMRRLPNGIEAKHFFQKEAPSHMPAWIARAPVRGGSRDSERDVITYPLVNDTSSLRWMVAMGCVDMHVWYSRVQHPENPDYVLFDLDPPPQVGFAAAVEVAHLVREVLEAVGLKGYPKTSGSDGIHVCVPIDPVYGYDDTRRFSQVVGGLLERAHPGLVTAQWAKGRRKGVFIDWRQNNLGATIASVYSVRPHPGAPISTPLAWDELHEELDPLAFDRDAVLDRIALHGDLFAPVLAGGQRLERVLAPGRSG